MVLHPDDTGQGKPLRVLISQTEAQRLGRYQLPLSPNMAHLLVPARTNFGSFPKLTLITVAQL